MIRKNYQLDRWSGVCPNCAHWDKEYIRDYQENSAVIYEYECNHCGCRWEVEKKEEEQNGYRYGKS
jgi:Zn ribbon nucleic-acid-binding protein